MLRESAMCPDADKASFEDISRHKYFNTNNLWVNLPALKVGAFRMWIVFSRVGWSDALVVLLVSGREL
jgi:hypothetical protein